MAIYLGWIALMLAVLLPLSKKYGDRTVVIYVALCAVTASVSIVCAKTFSTIASNAFAHGFETEFGIVWPFLTLMVMVMTCVISMGYVNKAMMKFDNSQVVPFYFALSHGSCVKMPTNYLCDASCEVLQLPSRFAKCAVAS